MKKLTNIVLSLLLGSALSCKEINSEINLVDKPVTSQSYQEIELKDALNSDSYLQLGLSQRTYSNGQQLWGYVLKAKGEKTIYASSTVAFYKNLELVLDEVKREVGPLPSMLIFDNDLDRNGADDFSQQTMTEIISQLGSKKVAYLNKK
ncbi:hypothetical protein HOG07_05470 [Candidatus Woesearchaeota archaeon]|nr:hypothetical protein [Candidatus Woesearchaeota archaeon]